MNYENEDVRLVKNVIWLWILSHRQVKISVDNLALPFLFIGNGSTIDKSITIGYGFHRNYDGMVKIGKKVIASKWKVEFCFQFAYGTFKNFFKKDKKKDKKTELQQTLNFKTKSEF